MKVLDVKLLVANNETQWVVNLPPQSVPTEGRKQIWSYVGLPFILYVLRVLV